MTSQFILDTVKGAMRPLYSSFKEGELQYSSNLERHVLRFYCKVGDVEVTNKYEQKHLLRGVWVKYSFEFKKLDEDEFKMTNATFYVGRTEFTSGEISAQYIFSHCPRFYRAYDFTKACVNGNLDYQSAFTCLSDNFTLENLIIYFSVVNQYFEYETVGSEYIRFRSAWSNNDYTVSYVFPNDEFYTKTSPILLDYYANFIKKYPTANSFLQNLKTVYENAYRNAKKNEEYASLFYAIMYQVNLSELEKKYKNKIWFEQGLFEGDLTCFFLYIVFEEMIQNFYPEVVDSFFCDNPKGKQLKILTEYPVEKMKDKSSEDLFFQRLEVESVSKTVYAHNEVLDEPIYVYGTVTPSNNTFHYSRTFYKLISLVKHTIPDIKFKRLDDYETELHSWYQEYRNANLSEAKSRMFA